MRPMLDDLELVQVQEILTAERRVLAEHKPPAMKGSLLQNLGRRPGHLSLWGVATGPESAPFVERLSKLFQAGEAVSFTADIVEEMGLEQVVIAALRVEELAGKPDRYLYVLTLREYAEPVDPAPAPLLDAGLMDEAQGLIDALTEGIAALPAFTSVLQAFVPRLQGILDQLRKKPG